MRSFVKIAVLAMALLGGVSAAHAQISIGIEVGAPPPPRVVYVEPPSPGPAFVWVAGYWYPVGGHYRWHEGYWTQPPYEGAYWVRPHYERGHFFVGYWDGGHGRVEHDHHWDHDGERDFYYHDHGHGHAYGHNKDHGHGHDHHDDD